MYQIFEKIKVFWYSETEIEHLLIGLFFSEGKDPELILLVRIFF